MTEPHPLTFEPILLPKAWGGRNLAALGKRLPPDEAVGESWELADLDATSPGGAGGGAVHSGIAAGPLVGRSIREAVAAWGPALLGSLGTLPGGGFPLLVKFLDAEEDLSVQVHPTPEYVREHPGTAVKTETWYVLHARPDAVMYAGLAPGIDGETFAREARAGRVVEHLRTIPARVGDCLHLPTGTIHALGRGVTVAEFQVPSDTTFRIWDWPDRYDRPGRDLHVDEALRCARIDVRPDTTRVAADATHDRLADAGAYDLWELRVDPGGVAAHPEDRGRCTVLVVVEGALEWDGPGSPAPVGSTVLVPPAWAARIRAGERSRVLAVGFPGA